MAVVPFVDGVVTLAAVDLSDHLKSASLEIAANVRDASSIADDWDVNVGGRKKFKLNLEFMDDFASAKVDATLQTAFFAGTSVAFTFKPTSGAISATNPEYQGSVLPEALPVGGGAGELLMKSVSLTGTGAITRDVTP